MSFDAKAYLDSVEPPVYTDSRGVEHRGRILSYEQWLPLQNTYRRLAQQGTPDYRGIRKAVKKLTRRMFPRPWYQWLNPFYRSVTKDVLALPPIAMLKAFTSFSEAQAQVMGVEVGAEDREDAAPSEDVR